MKSFLKNRRVRDHEWEELLNYDRPTGLFFCTHQKCDYFIAGPIGPIWWRELIQATYISNKRSLTTLNPRIHSCK